MRLRDQGRGVVGALVVSVELLFTMEMWWHGCQLPAEWLIVYALVGLAVVLAITRSVGFEAQEETRRSPLKRAATDFIELVLQSFVTAYAVLLLFGIVDVGDPPFLVARLGLLLVVPLGFGAALANKVTVIFRNAQGVGLTTATAEVDCDTPPPELTFEHVPVDDRRTGYVICPPGTENPTVTVSTWIEA